MVDSFFVLLGIKLILMILLIFYFDFFDLK